jgi:hypothetical protein
MILLVRLYQGTLSTFLGGECRFVPTCSEYFIQAVRLKGPWRGALSGTWRFLRCHPFSRGGYDPVDRPGAAGRANPRCESAKPVD